MKKVAFGILCMAAAVLLMSHNTFAYEVSRDVQLQGNTTYSFGTFISDPSNFSMLDNNKCIRATGIAAISRFTMYFTNNISVEAGDYLQIWFSVGINAENNSSDTMIRGLQLMGAGTNTFDLIEMTYEEVNPSNGIVKIMLRAKTNATYSYITFGADNAMLVLYNNEYIYAGSITNWRPLGQQSNQDIVNAINQQSQSTIQQQQKEQEAVDNIEDQTPSDISSSGNTENQASTNLIGAFSNFVSALTNIQTGNCNITLAFPQYAGGSRVVNICQNKDKAGNLISVFSSLTLIVFYIPLAIRLLTMIYNEIRSYTNG